MSVLIVLLFLLGLSGISAGLCMIAIPYGVIAAGAGLVLDVLAACFVRPRRVRARKGTKA